MKAFFLLALRNIKSFFLLWGRNAKSLLFMIASSISGLFAKKESAATEEAADDDLLLDEGDSSVEEQWEKPATRRAFRYCIEPCSSFHGGPKGKSTAP